MAAKRLDMRLIEKVWGRCRLPAPFSMEAAKEPIGEVWFEDPSNGARDLLIKYLVTSEKLSIQVHPRNNGKSRGKDEAWLIVEAAPDAVIGIGLKGDMSEDALRAAALDGTLETLVDWRPVRAGDFFFSPAGTIHALGAGLTLIEVQQNSDVTYRLFDYGRPRELHLDEALANADRAPYVAPFEPYRATADRQVLNEHSTFVLERWTMAASGWLRPEVGRPLWMISIKGSGTVDGQPLNPPGVWLVEEESRVSFDEGSEWLVAYPGAEMVSDLFVAAPPQPAIIDFPVPHRLRRRPGQVAPAAVNR